MAAASLAHAQAYGLVSGMEMDLENVPPPCYAGAGKDAFYMASDCAGSRSVSHQAASTSSVLAERPFQRQQQRGGSGLQQASHGGGSGYCCSSAGGLALQQQQFHHHQQQQQHYPTKQQQQQPLGGKGVPLGVVDIDANNAGNPLACAEYAPDIFAHLHEVEGECRPEPEYIERVQQDMTPHMRAILVDWLVEVALEYRLSSDTLHLTVALLDRFLSAAPVGRDQLQLAGIACMWAASKYEEIYAPSAREFCFITDNTYTPAQLVDMEARVLSSLSFRLTLPTAKVFLRRYLQASAADERLHFLSSFLCEAALMDEACMRHLPSSVAAASVFLARAMLGLTPWDPTLAHYSGRSPAAAAAAVHMVAATHRRLVEEATFTAIVDKYSMPKLLAVGKASPLPERHVAALLQACGAGAQ